MACTLKVHTAISRGVIIEFQKPSPSSMCLPGDCKGLISISFPAQRMKRSENKYQMGIAAFHALTTPIQILCLPCSSVSKVLQGYFVLPPSVFNSSAAAACAAASRAVSTRYGEHET